MPGRRALAACLLAAATASAARLRGAADETAAAARLRGAADDDRERRRLNARTRAAHHLAAMATHDDEAWCRSNKHAHHVKPGTSFGTLQADGQKEWVDRKCDQFFCKHHHRTGKGKYKCEPLAIPEEHLLALDNPGP